MSKSSGFSFAVLLAAVLFRCISAQQPTPSDIRPLALGKPVEREMKGGETHSYSIACKAGEFLNVVVEQKGIDVVLRWIDPQGKQLLAVDTQNGTDGPEKLSIICQTTGIYRLDVRPLEKSAPSGRYEAKIAALRSATEEDKTLNDTQLGIPATEPILRIETGMHISSITGASVDGNDRYMVTASADNTVRVWELPSFKLNRVIRPPLSVNGGGLGSVAISPDGKTIAVTGFIGTLSPEEGYSIFIFDRENGKMLRRLGHCRERFLTFSNDGRFLAVSAITGIRIYETKDYSMVGDDKDFEGDVVHGTFDSKGRLWVIADKYIRLYAPSSGNLLKLSAKKKVREGYSPAFISVSPDGSKLAVTLFSSTAAGSVASIPRYALDILSGDDLSFQKTLKTPERFLGYESAWSADGKFFYSAGPLATPNSAILRWRADRMDYYDEFTVAPQPPDYFFPLHNGGLIFVSRTPPFGTMAPDGDVSLSDNYANLNFGTSFYVFWTLNGEIPWVSQEGSEFQVKGSKQHEKFEFSIKRRDLMVNPLSKSNIQIETPTIPALKIDISNPRHPKLNGVPLNLGDGFGFFYSSTISPDNQKFVLGRAFDLEAFDRDGKSLWIEEGRYASISGDGKYAVVINFDGTISWLRMMDGKKLLTLFVHKDLKRWVLWTPDYYYDAAPGAEDLIGWHVNNGGNEAADFFPASQFRSRFYRPDIISKVLETGDVEQAVKLANAAMGRETQTSTVTQLLPPVVEIASPADNADVSTPTVTLRYSLRLPSGEPVTRVRALVDGRPVIENRQLTMQKDSASGVRELKITVPERDSEVSIIAENRFSTSVPATIRLKWRGAAPATEAFVIKPKLYVLAVGVSNYQNAAYSLKYAAKDAKDFAAAIALQNGSLYRDVVVKVLTDDQATKDEVLDGLDWIRKETTSKDVAMVFFAGHGINDQSGIYYFLPYNTDLDKLLRTGVAFTDIRTTVQSLAGKTLLFIDTCHSGNVLGGARRRGFGDDINGIINELASAENGAVVFAASTGNQSSLEDEKWNNGAFTKALVEGVMGKADYTGKGKITINMLDLYLSERVKELTGGKQTPTTAKPNTISDYPIAVKR